MDELHLSTSLDDSLSGINVWFTATMADGDGRRYRPRVAPTAAQYVLKNLGDWSIRSRWHSFLAARSHAADTAQGGRGCGDLRLGLDDPRLIGHARRRAEPHRIARLPEHR